MDPEAVIHAEDCRAKNHIARLMRRRDEGTVYDADFADFVCEQVQQLHTLAGVAAQGSADFSDTTRAAVEARIACAIEGLNRGASLDRIDEPLLAARDTFHAVAGMGHDNQSDDADFGEPDLSEGAVNAIARRMLLDHAPGVSLVEEGMAEDDDEFVTLWDARRAGSNPVRVSTSKSTRSPRSRPSR
jgi:hypothetical protein